MLEQLRTQPGRLAASSSSRPAKSEKNLKSLNKLLTFMLRHGYSRKTTLVAFGGGVVGDMAGFAAAIYLRGIDFIQAPDHPAVHGGQQRGRQDRREPSPGQEHDRGLLPAQGRAHQPGRPCRPCRTTNSSPGLAEVVKYARHPRPGAFFAFLEGNADGLLARRSPELLREVVLRSCAIKAEVVGNDERETGRGRPRHPELRAYLRARLRGAGRLRNHAPRAGRGPGHARGGPPGRSPGDAGRRPTKRGRTPCWTRWGCRASSRRKLDDEQGLGGHGPGQEGRRRQPRLHPAQAHRRGRPRCGTWPRNRAGRRWPPPRRRGAA